MPTSYANEPHVALLINDHTRLICTATAVLLECVDCGVITELQGLRHDTECAANALDLDGDAGIMRTSDLQPFDIDPIPFMTKIDDDDDRSAKDVGV